MLERKEEIQEEYPLFINPKQYLKFRKGWLFFGFLKWWSETRAITKCLKKTNGIQTVCDSPCGPGRLFLYWKKRGYEVIGVDLSDPMVEAADQMHKNLSLKGTVLKGDAFKLYTILPHKPDLVVSVRFIYYFRRDQRIALLKSLARTANRYILVQYKTNETYKGRRKERKSRNSDKPLEKQFCSYDKIIAEIKEAGLNFLHCQPISQTSDRVFVLAGK